MDVSPPPVRAGYRAGPATFDICCEPHEVVTQIALHGDFDQHAMVSVSDTLATARRRGAKMIVVDLRELTSIDATALWSLRCADAGCRASGVRLRLLVPVSRGHEALQDAFAAAGLGGQVPFTREPHLSALSADRLS